MTQEQLRMQMLAGIITESQYKEKLNESPSKIKDILSKIGDIEEKIYDKYSDEEIDAKFDYSKALDGIKEKYKDDEGKMYDALVSHLNKLKKSFPLK
jgi:ParB-like chromosome segregation protein Spo0J